MRKQATLMILTIAAALLVAPAGALADTTVVRPDDRADRFGTAPSTVMHADDRADRFGTSPVVIHPDDRADRFGTATGSAGATNLGSSVPAEPAVIVRITDGGFDWTSALIGSVATVGLSALLAGLALSLRRRGRVASA
jgi:hypothetical protein